jgi:hypothetical protein
MAEMRARSSLLVSRLLLLLLAALPAVSACGGGEANNPPSSTPNTKTGETPTPDGSGTAPASSAPSSPAADGSWPYGPNPSAEDKSAQLDRLKKDPGPIKSNWTPPGKSDRYGHAEGLISAPLDTVKAKIGDFAHYKDLAGPKFKSVKVVDKQGQNTDVYFQLPIMKGVVTIWYVTRFPPPRPAAGGDVVEGTYVKGNIKGMHIAFTVRPGVDDKSSVLVCDLVLQPNVPAPQSALDEELRDACGDAINAVRKTITGAN